MSEEHPQETADSFVRFQFATQRRQARLRMPLALRIIRIDADLPGGFAEGSSTTVRRVRDEVPIGGEVRLRKNRPPTVEQVDELRAWLRTHRPTRTAPRSAPPARTALPAEPPPGPAFTPRAARWPLAAVAVGLGAAILAVFVF